VKRLRPFAAHDVCYNELCLPLTQLPDFPSFVELKRKEGFSTSADVVEAFWQERGYNSSTQPTNYIPFSHYLSKLDASSPRDVYVATDDQETVSREISALEPNRFRFHFYPDSAVLLSFARRSTARESTKEPLEP
jgi:hypothetical protein